jgi:hypothetical protein
MYIIFVLYIYKMATFTSSLPDSLLSMLEKKAKELALPKNKLIERALSLYLDQLNKAAYLKSYKRMAQDADLLTIAEEGMSDYFSQLAKEDSDAAE